MHEEPQIPNYGNPSAGYKLHAGMCIAIEPMINLGSKKLKQLNDGWTVTTYDNKVSAHFEHNVALIDGRPELLSTFSFIYEAMGILSDEEKPFKKSREINS